MPTVLSTKILSTAQQQLVLNAGLGWVHADFIATKGISFKSDKTVKNAVFTSKNGVNAVISKGIQVENAFCVGIRTKALLEENGIPVTLAEKNGEALGNAIVEHYSNTIFTYFCAVDRLDILPNILKEAKVSFEEIAVYKTLLTSKRIASHFDGVLFFSPSGVESFFKENELIGKAFCIGNTTANAIKKYTTNYTVANTPSIENVLVTAINYYRTL